MKPTHADRDPAFDRLIARGLERETDVTGNACPDADLLAAWFDRSLSRSEGERIEAHAASCAVCQQILADLARSEPELVRAAPVPEPRRPLLWHWRWLVPAATVAVVVVVVGTRVQRTPQMLSTVAVQPEIQQPAAPAPDAAAASKPEAVPPPLLQRSTERRQAAKGLVPRPAPVRAETPEVAPPRPTEEVPFQARADAAAGVSGAAPEPVRPPEAQLGIREMLRVTTAQTAAPAPGAAAAARPVAAKSESRASEPAVVVTSPSGRVAWRVGAAGRIERSTDGRVSWQPQPSGISTPLAAASSAGDGICWAVGASGVVLKTTDGSTWQRLPAPARADLLAVRAASADSATVTAADGSEFVTSDGGWTWTKR